MSDKNQKSSGDVPGTKRRDVLKSVGTTMGAAGLSVTGSASQSYYTVKLFESGELYNSEGYLPMDRSETFLEGASDRIGATVGCLKSDNIIPTPIQDHNQSFEAKHPCFDVDVYYENLLQWWEDYAKASCKDVTTVTDSNILMTEGRSAGMAYRGGNTGVVSKGTPLSDLPSFYISRGTDSAVDAMSTLMEEIGHNLQKTDWENGESYQSEQTGDSIYDDGFWYVTPLGEGAQGKFNECGSYVSEASGHEMTWDECTVEEYWY